MPTTDEFRSRIKQLQKEAMERGAAYIDVNAGELHRNIGGYPGSNHQMPSCCQAMYDVQKLGDLILSSPPKGKGASLTIRYNLLPL